VSHALLTGLLAVAMGCGSVSPANQDGGGGSGSGASGQAGGAGGSGGSSGVGGGGSGGGKDAGTDGPARGYCDTDMDCVFENNSGCCGECIAKTDTIPPRLFCGIACPAAQPSCLCLNHQCGEPSCPPPGGGACQYCPNGYVTGPGGCSTCFCKPGDAGTDSRTDGGSPGSVTLRLVIPAGRSFCDQSSTCGGTSHITILNNAGQPVGISIPSCSTICSAACTPVPCPLIACIQEGVAVKTTELQWDGSSYSTSTCGNRMTCYQPGFAPAGHYVARMCATPGNIANGDGGVPSLPVCTASGPVECVDVPFDFPGPSPIVGTLP
jgi:hypothetical protein